MGHVFTYIGSPHGNRSNTYTLARMMLERLAEKDCAISYEILTSAEAEVNYCRGCWSCMRGAYAPGMVRMTWGG